jgi:hypothetical protein
MLLANGSHHLSNMNQLDMATLLKPTSLEGQHPYPAMYDHLLSCKKRCHCWRALPRKINLLLSRSSPVMPCSVSVWDSGDKFPLAVAQRDALSHYLTQQPGDILAVNGPPGTGNHWFSHCYEWARAALNKTEPPVVIATSTNNQAVTNIIEAFGKDFATGTGPMAGRWLPDVKSFGAYFPSSGRRAEAVKIPDGRLFNRVESLEYVEDARCFFLEKARAAFPNEECHSPEQVVDLLHQRLVELSAELEQIEPAWDDLNAIRQERHAISDDLEQYIQDKRTLLLNSTNEISLLTQGKKQWEQYRAGESIMFALFLASRRSY